MFWEARYCRYTPIFQEKIKTKNREFLVHVQKNLIRKLGRRVF
jgi:hypothetical protein